MHSRRDGAANEPTGSGQDGAQVVGDLERSPARLRQLFEAVLEITSELELPELLRRVVDAAEALVDCKFAALGIRGTGDELSGLVSAGLDADDVGFPFHCPPTPSFLCVPVSVHKEAFGDLCVAQKNSGEDFTEDDERLLLALAAAAGMAIANARLYTEADLHRRLLQASAAISNALFQGEDPDSVLPVVAAQARKLAKARAAFIAFRDDGWLVVEAVDTVGPTGLLGVRIPSLDTMLGRSLTTRRPTTTARASSYSATLSDVERERFGPDVMAVPFGHKRNSPAVLAIIGSEGGPHFETWALPMLSLFATQTSLALDTAKSRHDSERLLMFEDRDRIARDLHDLVIQRLFATGMHLENTVKLIDNPEVAARIRSVVDDLDMTIHEIRATIFGLKSQPSAQAVSLRTSILVVVEESASRFGFAPAVRMDGLPGNDVPQSVTADLLVVAREALSNAARHAKASHVQVIVNVGTDRVDLHVIDDGIGIRESSGKSGLANIAARAKAHGGKFSVRRRREGGTVLSWSVPV